MTCCLLSPSLQVVVPRTYAEYTSRRVLTTQWLEGEKLSQSQADDVGRLVNVSTAAAFENSGQPQLAQLCMAHMAAESSQVCGPLPSAHLLMQAALLPVRCMCVQVGVICYLKQLLDTGFFHAGQQLLLPLQMIARQQARLIGPTKQSLAVVCAEAVDVNAVAND